MKKFILFLSFIICTLNNYSQNVGIGTDKPNSRLQVNHNSSSATPGFLLMDSSLSGIGWMRFQSQATNRYFDFSATQSGTLAAQSFIDIFSDSAYIATLRGNGNLGINSPFPNDKLEVNGNINLTGTIKANGTDGTANQVLMKNEAGQLAWGDMIEYKNMVTFRTGSSTWTIPAGVTKFLVEVWGAGGGGNWYGGGGGGSYVRAQFVVNPAATSVSYGVGTGGSGSALIANTGTTSSITYDGVTINALGGVGATFAGTAGVPGAGGDYNVSAGFLAFSGIGGSTGFALENNFIQTTSTTFIEIGKGGNGGNAGNAQQTGGRGAYVIYNNTGVIVKSMQKTNGVQPGGGGGSGYAQSLTPLAPGVTNGANGGNGLVIIRY